MPHRVGLVGYGYWGQIAAKYLEASSGLELALVVEPTLPEGGMFTSRFDQLIADESIGTVYIAAPAATHYRIARQALLAGKNILCEKPLAFDPAEVRDLIRMAERSELVLHTDFTYTCSRGVRKLKELLPHIGDVLYCELTLRQLGRFYPESVYHVLGCHLLSVVDLCWGLGGMDFQFEEVIRNEKGVCETGVINFSRGRLSGRMFVSLNSGERERRIVVYGSTGFLTFDALAPKTVVLQRFARMSSQPSISATEEFEFDERNNLRLMLDEYVEILAHRAIDNRGMSLEISEVLAGR